MLPLLLLLPAAHAARTAPGEPPSAAALAIIGLIGVFPIIASWRNWDWFFQHRKARLFVSLFGRQGARAFYVLLGVVLICISIGGIVATR